MSAAMHGPRVTQADADFANGLAEIGLVSGLNVTRIAEFAARHREASQAELVEALGRIAEATMSQFASQGAMASWMKNHAEAALTKARTDATGEGA